MRGGPSAVALVLMLAACAYAPNPSDAPVSLAEPVNPLSKVNVHNPTDEDVYVKLLWSDGFDQIFQVEPHSTQFLTGAIGTVAMPANIEVLTLDCEVIASMAGLPEGAGLVVVADDGAQLFPIRKADARWGQADHPQSACGVTIQP